MIMGVPLNFEDWKGQFRNDCVKMDKLSAFDSLGETVLQILFDSGLDPTVDSVVSNGLPGSKKPAKPVRTNHKSAER